MEQLGVKRRVAVAGALAIVAAGVAFIIALRASYPGPEPAGQNWWLIAWLAMAAGYGAAGAALVWRPPWRRVAMCFLVIAASSLVTAISVQYTGYVTVARGAKPPLPRLAEANDWARPLLSGVLAALLPWECLPAAVRRQRWITGLRVVATVALVWLIVTSVFNGPDVLDRLAAWPLCIVATAGTATLAVWWWRRDRTSPDLLPAWLLAGAIAAWLAVVPDLSDLASWRLRGREVVTPLLFLATVPLLAGGMVMEFLRRSPSGRAVHRVVRRRVRRLADRLMYGSGEDPQIVVQRVLDEVGAGTEFLPQLAQTLRRELNVDAVAIDVRSGDDWRRVASSGGPTADVRVIELRHQDEVIGHVVLGWEPGPLPHLPDEEVLAQLSGPLTIAVRWARLVDDLRRSKATVVLAREEERRRLRRDLHDGLGPALTGIALGVRVSATRVDGGEHLDETAQLLALLADEVDIVVGDVRRIARDLRPTALDQLGFVEAVREFTRKFEDLEIQLDLPDGPITIPAAVEVAAYRIVTEAVTNVVRHAKASRCWLSITAGESIGIDVVDDGIGTNGQTPVSGVGLLAMRERAAELGGSVDLRTIRPHGTHLHVDFPLVPG